MNFYLTRIKGEMSDRLVEDVGLGCSENIEKVFDSTINQFKKNYGEDIKIIDIKIRLVAE